jgi:hypothetical protein
MIYVKNDPKVRMATAESPADTPPEEARHELQEAIPKAATTLTDLLDAEDERVQIRAAEAILDRAGLTKAKRVTATTATKEVGGERSELNRLVNDTSY